MVSQHHLNGKESAAGIFPEDTYEGWTTQTVAGDLLLMHNRDHPVILHPCVVLQLQGIWQESSAAGCLQCPKKSMERNYQPTPTVSGKQPASTRTPPSPVITCLTLYHLADVTRCYVMLCPHNQIEEQLLPQGNHCSEPVLQNPSITTGLQWTDSHTPHICSLYWQTPATNLLHSSYHWHLYHYCLVLLCNTEYWSDWILHTVSLKPC